jgi:hypothetical protein
LIFARQKFHQGSVVLSRNAHLFFEHMRMTEKPLWLLLSAFEQINHETNSVAPGQAKIKALCILSSVF